MEKREDRADRFKVLLIAYACSPETGSEPKSGWNRALQTQRVCDTWVICEKRESENAIARFAKGRDQHSLPTFCYVGHTMFERLLARVPGFYYAAYNLWHRRAYRLARRLHENQPFDVVHQATMCGYREPGYCWKLDAPFVWGPVGGTQNYPWIFLRYGSWPGALREACRSVLNNIQLRLSPRIREVARRADVILAGNSTNQRDLKRVLGADSILMTTTGLPDPGLQRQRFPVDGPLRILWSGPHNYGKALFLLIEALHRVRNSLNFRLVVLGDGPEHHRWQQMAARAEIGDRCSWTGHLPLRDALAYFEHSDVFAFTSLRDTAANVVLEALAAAVPVVCFDLHGGGDVVTDKCGIKISTDVPEYGIKAYGEALLTLDRDRELLETLSQGARARMRDYLWELKVTDTVAIYQSVAGGRIRLY